MTGNPQVTLKDLRADVLSELETHIGNVRRGDPAMPLSILTIRQLNEALRPRSLGDKLTHGELKKG